MRRKVGTADVERHEVGPNRLICICPATPPASLGGGVSTGGQVLAVAAAASAVIMAATGRLVDRVGRGRLLLTLDVTRGVPLLVAAVCAGTAQQFGFAMLFGASSFPVIPLTVAVLSALTPGRWIRRCWIDPATKPDDDQHHDHDLQLED